MLRLSKNWLSVLLVVGLCRGQLEVTLDSPFVYYLPKQKFVSSCRIICDRNSPLSVPNITWTFLKVLDWPSHEQLEMVKLKNYSVKQNGWDFDSVVTMTIEVPGELTCKACNIDGCESDTSVVYVSDVPNGFGIMKTDEMERVLMVDDNVEIICARAIGYNAAVHWLDHREIAVTETDRISITNSLANYTYYSTLRIKNLRKSDDHRDYICEAQNGLVPGVRSTYTLLVHNPMAPSILETNMNKTTVTVDLSTERYKVVILKCHVEGVPKPNVMWYKDGTRISANEQYECRYNNQELYIKYWLAENSGNYTCKVENPFGKRENYQIISVKVKEASKVLIILIVVLVLICAILVIYLVIKIHREQVMRKQLMKVGLTHFKEGALQCLNPNLTVHDQAELLPYDKKWEFPRERLKFGKQLGSGAFGVVMKADALGICKDEAVSTVAVKMVRKSTADTYIRALTSELKIMVHLGKHLNIVNLLGACTKNIMARELLVIIEYCHFGNLHDYLLRHRGEFINQIDPATLNIDPSIGLDLLTKTTSVGSNNRLVMVLILKHLITGKRHWCMRCNQRFTSRFTRLSSLIDTDRIKYAALSFSQSLNANSSNSNPGTELISYTTGTDFQGMSPDNGVLSNNSTQASCRLSYRGNYKDQNLKPTCTQNLLSWAFQVARGMEYLSQRKVLHGDLAARNILLAENNIVKICDFGLAKTMYKDDNYIKQGGVPLPIKWMAIESIRDRVFSTQSDIWSFGIVLWEFFTLAKTPYPSMEAKMQYQRLTEGYRMEQPEYATDEVYDIMLQCWKETPTLRPTFTYLVSSIGDLLEETVKEHYMDLNASYMDMNTVILESGKDDYLMMMSAPDHHALVSPNNDDVTSLSLRPAIPQRDSCIPMSTSIHGGDLGILSSGITSSCDKINFPTRNRKSHIHSDSKSTAVELSPMLNHEDNNYLKLINVQEQPPEFA